MSDPLLPQQAQQKKDEGLSERSVLTAPPADVVGSASRTAHTPGPWSFREFHGSDEDLAMMRQHGMTPVQALSNDGQRFIMAPGEDFGRRVALVDSMTVYKRGKGHTVECAERDANARLIAAAPDLLAALLYYRDGCSGAEPSLSVFHRMLDEAVAKATGAA